MSDSVPSSPATPKWKPLDARQRRVLGALIEKAKTTPAGYPMTVNAVVIACNQKNNRDPIMSLDDFGVEKALDELRNMGAVSEVDWVGRVSKWKHHAYDWLGVDKPEIAVMTELLLRGAQAVGELRARAARMEPIADLATLRPIVSALIDRGLVIELTPAGRGQTVSHNLYMPSELEELRSQYGRGSRSTPDHNRDEIVSSTVPGSLVRPHGGDAPGSNDPLARLSTELADLRAEVERLRQRVQDLEDR